jgi:hypothetical protein
MNGLFAVAAAALAIVPFLLFLLLRRARNAHKVVYQRHSELFSPEQRMLHAALKQAVGDRYEIMGKVPIGDLISPKKGTLAGAAPVEFEEIADGPLTFVLCRSGDLSVVGAVLLVPRGRNANPSPSRSGASVESLCDAAGLPLVRIESAPLYEITELRDQVLDAIEGDPLPGSHPDGRMEPRISNFDDLDLG